MPIRRLPPLLVNQIAAGEVVERPASVVKELVENSLDAGATRVRVEIEQGGRELIRVIDDGAGIDPEDLPLAIAPHATSKIAAAEDLEAVRTLGFRGEALASIASVSRMRIVSRPRGAETAAVIETEGDRVEPVRPAAGPQGTRIEVRSLFFNVPARRKFLRGESTEAGRIADLIAALAMAQPHVGFTLTQDGRAALEVPLGHSARDRVAAILGRDVAPELLEARSGDEGAWVRVWGLVGRPSTARRTGRALRIFVNGRVVADRVVLHAVREAYRGLIDPTRHPTAAVFLEVDPGEVDVNVHPTKAEVRFRNSSAIHQAVHRAVRAALRAADLVPEFDLGRGGSRDAERARGALPSFVTGSEPLSGAGPAGIEEPGSAGGPAAAVGSGSGSGGSAAAPYGESDDLLRRAAAALRSGSGGFSTPAAFAPGASAPPSTHPGSPGAAARSAVARGVRPPIEQLPIPVAAVRVLQVHDAYLVLEDAEGLRIIDQHALHERAMFERIRTRLAAGALERQRLLLPQSIEADPGRMESLARVGPLLERLGIDAEPSGPRTIAIHALPTLLFERGVDPVRFVEALLDRATDSEESPSEEGALGDVIAMMACKAAIKAGDRLRAAEIDELLRRADELERSSACPHGRPTTLRISLRQLDRQFGR
ncbi:MAG TPA: DNA mismatch repair endonuclease MutL [Phycisphaerales bacterium]|nr:DNA mismatch repair endonuclease MutL [Phycisphaerales bacterium]HMP36501.1 DNA mismatch repair endonuclease MutL [Phycisphaerales bacterium]